MYALQISSISTAEPVEIADVKTHLKIQTTAEDTLIDLYITAARQSCENLIKRSLVDTRWALMIDDFYSSRIELPRPPLSTVVADITVSYRKTDGNTTNLSSTYYTIEHRAEPGFLRLNHQLNWPNNVQDSEGAVTISYRSGYSSVTETTACPEGIKHWIKMRVGQMLEYRESLTDERPARVQADFVDGLLDPYKVISIA